MKFPRNAKIFRGHMDVTPFAGVFFCLLIFVMLSFLTYTPGVQISLPESSMPLAGADGPTLSVALDSDGRFIFNNQVFDSTNLMHELQAGVARQKEPLTLVVLADKNVTV